MGTSVNNILDIQTSSFVAPSNFLTLTNGAFKLSTTGVSTIIPYTTAATIPQSGAIWLNSALSSISTQAGLTMYGNITVSNGVFNIGNAADQDLLSNGGYLTINNGTLNIAGKYYAVGINNLSKFSITGGSVIVPYIGSTNTTIAPFQIAGAGSQFNMNGGSLIIPREGGTGAQNLGFVNTGTSGGSVTGGTLQIGSSSSPASQIIQINSNFSVGNILVNSSNVNASLLTNSLSVINDVAINSGTLTSSNLNISLGGNWNNNGGMFVSGSETVAFLGTSSQTIFKTGGETFNNITFSNAGTKTLLSAITASNCLINSGSNLDVNTANNQLSIKGDYTNNGTYNARNGLVLLNGTVAQTIGGASTTNFYDLTINNTAGAGLSNAESLLNTLTLINGTFNTNGKIFTMISTASNTARIAPITGSGNILGNVTVQRYAPGGYTGWALLGAPITSSLTYQDWDDNMPISCASCPDGSAGGFISIYTYDETAVGSYSSAASYIPMTGITNPISANKGYWVYLGTSYTSSAPITIDVVGSVGKFNTAIPLTRTNTGSVVDDGWNLISNPYPSPIKWSLLKGATANIDNAIYTYNADLNGGLGGSASYVNGISSPAVGAGGIGDTIPMCQGFYVHSTGATVLNAAETNKVAGNPTFLKMSNTSTVASSSVPLIRLHLDGNYNFSDETVVYLQSGATNNFDTQYDAIKMGSQDPSAPSVRLFDGNAEFQVNGISPASSNFTMPLLTTTGYTGTYTISLANFNSFPTGACITLYDTYFNTTTDLKNSNYVFTLEDTTTVSRFTLNITINPLNITSNLVQPTCINPTFGEIAAKGTNAGPWNYFWKNATGVIIKTSLNKVSADTITNLLGGNYTLEVNTVGLCDNNDSQFSIHTIEIPVAQFSSTDTSYLSNNGAISFINNSVNSISHIWDFGDMNGTSTLINPTYNYISAGVYTVSLIAESNSGCLDTTRKNIVIVDNTSGIKNPQNTMGLVLKTLENNIFILNGSYTESEKVQISINDIQGKNVFDFGFINSQKIQLPIDLSSVNAGIYYLVVEGNKTKVVFKLPVK
jgi:PKD repeat protein